MTATEEKAPKRSTVIHKMTVHDELPPLVRKPSVLEEALESIKEKAIPSNKWTCIAQYESTTAAAGAANNLRRLHGSSPTVEGWRFATRKVQDGDVFRTGLFVQYDKRLVKPEAKAEHQAKLDKWKADQKRKADAKKAKASK